MYRSFSFCAMTANQKRPASIPPKCSLLNQPHSKVDCCNQIYDSLNVTLSQMTSGVSRGSPRRSGLPGVGNQPRTIDEVLQMKANCFLREHVSSPWGWPRCGSHSRPNPCRNASGRAQQISANDRLNRVHILENQSNV